MSNFKQQQIDFAAYIRHPNEVKPPSGLEARRLKIYEDLFFHSLSSLLAGAYPVIHDLLEGSQWNALMRSFYRPENNITPHFPEIPREFLSFIQESEPLAESHPFLAELALYEWLELHLEKHMKSVAFQENDLNDHIPVINPVSSLNAFSYPVHQISRQNQPKATNQSPTFLLLWRDQTEHVQFTELNAFSALLWEKLQANTNKTGLELLLAMAEDMQAPDEVAFSQHGMNTLKQWQQQGIISHNRRQQ